MQTIRRDPTRSPTEPETARPLRVVAPIAAGARPRPSGEREVQRLVRAAQRGDRDAMRALYVRYASEVRMYVARIVPRQDAEDVAQEVFAKLLTELSRYRPGDAPFSAWVLRVARNQAIDHLRRNRLVPCDDVRVASPLADESARDRAAALWAVLATLTPGQRNVLVLSHLVGLTPVEIASRMGLSVRSVHCLQHRGRCAARIGLGDLGAAPATARPPAPTPWSAVAPLEAA
jgi:RNA polymerase sigma-70 factor (ECF subfamily)